MFGEDNRYEEKAGAEAGPESSFALVEVLEGVRLPA